MATPNGFTRSLTSLVRRSKLVDAGHSLSGVKPQTRREAVRHEARMRIYQYLFIFVFRASMVTVRTCRCRAGVLTEPGQS